MKEIAVRHHPPTLRLAFVLACMSAVALTAVTVAAQYTMTVNKDRLINAQNEPQNWLMMNGDYGSTRYSKLSQITRDNVKTLHLVWAMALGGMQDCTVQFPHVPVDELRAAAVTGALATLGFDSRPNGGAAG